jgi:hypothetical protein
MSIIYSFGSKPIKLPDNMSYDINEKKYYSLMYRPATWSANKEYKKGIDVVIPSLPNGLYYECSSGGISGANEPSFGTVEKGTTTDGSVEWIARPYDLLLDTGDTISASTWSGANGEMIDNASIVAGIQTKCRLVSVPAGADAATLTNHITVTRANGDVEEFDRSIIIKVKFL